LLHDETQLLPVEKPKVAELTKDSLLEAFKRASVDSLPIFLKIADVQFEVVNSVHSHPAAGWL
jgi:hypothetical protein